MPSDVPLSSHSNPPPLLMPPETDALFRKWLKLQIASMYWGMVFKVIMFALIAGSIIFSTITLAPIVTEQLNVLMNLQRTVSGLSGGGMNNTPNNSAPPFDISDIIKQLAPKSQLNDQLQPEEEPEIR